MIDGTKTPDGPKDNGELGDTELDKASGGAKIPRPLNPQPLPPITL